MRLTVTAALISILGCTVLAGCPRRPPGPPPPAPVMSAPSGLRVSLTWAGPADLDLYVTGPSWETVYFGNNPGKNGGKLKRDVRCSDIQQDQPAPLLESISFPNPVPGRYRVGVDYIETCNGPDEPVPFRVVVEYGSARHEQLGLARHHQFAPIVADLELRHVKPNGPLTLVTEGQPETHK
jgi:hypothetical protein